MDVHPPKNGSFIGVDPYPHSITLYYSVSGEHSIYIPGDPWASPAVCFSTLSWQERWQGRASCSKICQLLADPMKNGGEQIWLVVLPSGKLT